MDNINNKLLRINQIKELTGLSRSTLERMSKEGAFPQKITLGPNSVAWFEREVMEWIDKKGLARLNT